jgi:hypothetical protein
MRETVGKPGPITSQLMANPSGQKREWSLDTASATMQSLPVPSTSWMARQTRLCCDRIRPGRPVGCPGRVCKSRPRFRRLRPAAAIPADLMAMLREYKA